LSVGAWRRRRAFADISAKWSKEPLRSKVTFANDSITIQVRCVRRPATVYAWPHRCDVLLRGRDLQLSEMFQHLHDIDAGDLPPAAEASAVPKLGVTAAHAPSIGPSTHTNPLMTLEFQMKALHSDQVPSLRVRTSCFSGGGSG
jgi:hypothetical protein